MKKKHKSSTQVFYWDSSVFIAFFSGEKGRCDNVEQILEEAESGNVYIVTSSFTEVEVIKLKGCLPIKIDQQKKITEFFEKDYFLFVDATRKVTELARDLIWKYPGLFPKDAVHLAFAVVFSGHDKLDAIHSYDRDFLDLNGKYPMPCQIIQPVPNQLTMKLGVPHAPKKGAGKGSK